VSAWPANRRRLLSPSIGMAMAKRVWRTRKMPLNVIRTPEEGIAWGARQGSRAREEYPDATGERFLPDRDGHL